MKLAEEEKKTNQKPENQKLGEEERNKPEAAQIGAGGLLCN